MASTFTPLGIELQATGENAGTWGTKTNTNLQLSRTNSWWFYTHKLSGDSGDTDLSVSDGWNRCNSCTQNYRIYRITFSDGRNVTIPIDVQDFYTS